jgi:hypothetical protein
MDKITLGYAPTRRSIFSAPDALKYRNLTKKHWVGGNDRQMAPGDILLPALPRNGS